jgi:hypothetical protein
MYYNARKDTVGLLNISVGKHWKIIGEKMNVSYLLN